MLALTLSAGIVRAQHDMSSMTPAGASSLVSVNLARLGSGTAWLPDSSDVPMITGSGGGWSIMAHGRAFGMFDRQWTLHGDTRAAVLDWEMASASRPLGDGLLRFTAMTSLESFFLPDTGFPQLLQTGETFRRRRIANTQHPHDLIGELSASYDHPLMSNLALSSYVAAVGDPALGPVSYRHRPSAADDPFPPLGHHSQDALHGSHGVVTLGAYGRRLKVEGSAFNAREPDERRHDLDYAGARLDSYSGRLTAAPTGNVVVSTWVGYLAAHDPLAPALGMQRYGASVLTETRGIRGGRWSTALIWGLDDHHHDQRLHDHEETNQPPRHLMSSVAVESNLGLGPRTQLFARAEQVQKMADELGFLGGNLMETYTVRALSLGASREVAIMRAFAVGAGGKLTFNFLPETLHYTYTTTHPAGFALSMTVTPRR